MVALQWFVKLTQLAQQPHLQDVLLLMPKLLCNLEMEARETTQLHLKWLLQLKSETHDKANTNKQDKAVVVEATCKDSNRHNQALRREFRAREGGILEVLKGVISSSLWQWCKQLLLKVKMLRFPYLQAELLLTNLSSSSNPSRHKHSTHNNITFIRSSLKRPFKLRAHLPAKLLQPDLP